MKAILQGAFLTVLTLFGGMLVGVVVGNLVFEVLPGHNPLQPGALQVTLAAIPAVLGILTGAASFGLAMGRLARVTSGWRMAWAGVLGFVPITIILSYGLLALEPFAVEKLGTVFPIHRIFTFLFVPTAFVVAGVSAGAIGLGLRDRALAWSLLWKVGLAALVAFLIVNLSMEALGWVVSAPDAAKRFTMLTVMFVGALAAALAGGGVMGRVLTKPASKPM